MRVHTAIRNSIVKTRVAIIANQFMQNVRIYTAYRMHQITEIIFFINNCNLFVNHVIKYIYSLLKNNVFFKKNPCGL